MDVLWLLVLGFLLPGAAADRYVVPPARLAPSPYPEWAHYHWSAALVVPTHTALVACFYNRSNLLSTCR